MSDEKDQVSAGSSGPAEEADKLTQGVARFAQYTAPAMLALLASGGHNMAFAQTSTPPA
jgi:hypothetical protein